MINGAMHLPPSTKPMEQEARVCDELLTLIDLSKQPRTNDRVAKLGNFQFTRIGAVARWEDEDRRRITFDGIETEVAADLFLEPDNLVWRRHETGGPADLPHAIRLLVDQQRSHASEENRSTFFIDQRDRQGQGASHDLFSVEAVPAQRSRSLRFNGAGVNLALVPDAIEETAEPDTIEVDDPAIPGRKIKIPNPRKLKNVDTGPDGIPALTEQEYHLTLNASFPAGWVTDRRRLGQLQQMIGFPNVPGPVNRDGLQLGELALRTDVIFDHRSPDRFGPLAMADENYDPFILEEGHPLIGYLWPSKKKKTLPGLDPMALNPLDDNLPLGKLRPPINWRVVVFLQLFEIVVPPFTPPRFPPPPRPTFATPPEFPPGPPGEAPSTGITGTFAPTLGGPSAIEPVLGGVPLVPISPPEAPTEPEPGRQFPRLFEGLPGAEIEPSLLAPDLDNFPEPPFDTIDMSQARKFGTILFEIIHLENLLARHENNLSARRQLDQDIAEGVVTAKSDLPVSFRDGSRIANGELAIQVGAYSASAAGLAAGTQLLREQVVAILASGLVVPALSTERFVGISRGNYNDGEVPLLDSIAGRLITVSTVTGLTINPGDRGYASNVRGRATNAAPVPTNAQRICTFIENIDTDRWLAILERSRECCGGS